MALFRRNKNKDVLPEEVREYYQAERRERTGMAWLLAIATLLVTFLIAAALFFGGRWLYRTIFDNDDNKGTTTSQSENQGSDNASSDNGSSDQSGNTSNSSDSSSSDSGTSGSEGQTSSTNTDTPSGSTGSVSGSSTTGGSSSSSGSAATTPETGPSELANTGAGDIFAIYIIVVVAATLGHYALANKKK